MADTPSRSWLTELLQNEFTNKYFIEHNVFRSNHLAHGIIALHRLGASENRIRQFIEWYVPNTELPDYSNHQGENPDAPPADDNQLDSLLGERKCYYEIRNRYQMKLADLGSLSLFIEKEFPKVGRGMSCSALHGLIHLGYGYSARSSVIVCGGMAYLHHSYKGLIFDIKNPDNEIRNFGRGSFSIMEVLNEIRSDTVLKQGMLDGAKDLSRSNWKGSTFMYRLNSIMQAGDELIRYTNKIKLPNCIVKSKSNVDHPDAIKVADWLLQEALSVFTLSERPMISSCFKALQVLGHFKQIIPVLKHQDAIDALRTFTCVLLGTYLGQDSPDLVSKTKLRNYSDIDNRWNKLIGETLSSDRNEHIYKLIQVAYETWRENRNNDSGALYITAAELSLNNDLSFIE